MHHNATLTLPLLMLLKSTKKDKTGTIDECTIRSRKKMVQNESNESPNDGTVLQTAYLTVIFWFHKTLTQDFANLEKTCKSCSNLVQIFPKYSLWSY